VLGHLLLSNSMIGEHWDSLFEYPQWLPLLTILLGVMLMSVDLAVN
jgi:hypothetical protein